MELEAQKIRFVRMPQEVAIVAWVDASMGRKDGDAGQEGMLICAIEQRFMRELAERPHIRPMNGTGACHILKWASRKCRRVASSSLVSELRVLELGVEVL